MKRLLVILLAMGLTACPTDDSPSNNGANNGTDDMGNNGTGDMGETTELSLRTLSPTSGNVGGGTSVTLTGTGFVSGMSVQFGENAATDVVVVTSTTATAVTPAGDTGEVDVTVTNPDSESVSKAGAFTYQEALDPNVDFCRLQAQSPVSGTPGEATDLLFAVVFADGLTQGEGQGDYVEGELGWGSGADVAQYSFTTMSYNVDKDGLNPGDLANDEYGASLTVPSAGEYKYVARFRTQQRDEWLYCDLDGSDNGVSEDQLGVLNITNPTQPSVSFCQLQAQSPLASTTGEASPQIYALVFVEGLTAGDGPGSGVVGEVGWGSTTDGVNAFTYTSMTYDSDQDGLTQGDKANDQHAGTVAISSAGEYRYAARFKVGDGDWAYCDLDGVGTANPGTITVNDPVQPTVGFCQTETATASAITNQASGELTATVFVAGSTQGAGQGTNVMGQIVWGAAGSDPTTWTETATSTYKEDADGLVSGDLANDRYTGTITATSMGDYEYVHRFSVDGGTTWTLCDTDGNGGTPFEPTKLGALSVNDVVVNRPDECKLQFPQIHTKMLVGESISIYGRVIESGVTGGGTGGQNVVGELMVGPMGSDPINDAGSFTSVNASVRSSGVINPAPMEDEYEASFTATAEGDYKFLYRFSVDGGTNWSYCDIDGTGSQSQFNADGIGVASVFTSANSPDLIDYCNIWQTAVSATSQANSPIITIETFEAGITDTSNTQPGDIEVEVGYGQPYTNPAISGAFTWNSMKLPYKGVHPQNTQNWEYEGDIYPSSAKPSTGSYVVAVRVKRATDGAWAYCDTNNSTMNYFVGDATTLSVTAP